MVGVGSSTATFGLQSAATRFVAFMAHDDGESRVISKINTCALIDFHVRGNDCVYSFITSTFFVFYEEHWFCVDFATGGAWLFSITISGIFQGLVQGMKKYASLARILMSANLAMVCLTVLGLSGLHSVIVPIIAWVFYGALICFGSLVITREGLLPAKSTRTQGQTFKQVIRFSIPLGIAGVLNGCYQYR